MDGPDRAPRPVAVEQQPGRHFGDVAWRDPWHLGVDGQHGRQRTRADRVVHQAEVAEEVAAAQVGGVDPQRFEGDLGRGQSVDLTGAVAQFRPDAALQHDPPDALVGDR